MKTLIAVPCMDQVAAPFAQSLASLERTGDVVIGFEISSLIYSARNNFAKKAITEAADALLFFDSDMTFEPDTLKRMAAHMEAGLDIVTGLYFKRKTPFTPVLFSELRRDENGAIHWKDMSDLPDGGMFEVEGCGMGCCMIRKDVLVNMLLNFRTWFTPLEGLGEDLAFCLRARQLGYKIMCDPSIKLGHVGQITVDESLWRAAAAQRRG